jgi:mono/diheme cytochrome c family protein
MRPVLKAFLLFIGVAVLVAVGGGLMMMSTGFSARPEPSSLEALGALTIRNLAIGWQSQDLSNPVLRSPGVIASGREHFADHCASCHANNGSGDTAIGRGLYPRAPDMRLARTQNLSDGQLFYIIENGVRLTGMPAWGTGDSSGESASWMLVHFIRHLPELSEPELVAMAKLNPVSPDELRQRMMEEQFLGNDAAPAGAPPPPASPHKH